MKVFFSWSGHLSKKVAKAFKPWLTKDIFPEENLSIFISEEDIEYGSEWYQKIRQELLDCDLAVIFLTPENMNSSWLNFEAGAIAIGEEKRPLIAFLIDVPMGSIKSPLKQYQCFSITNETMTKLVRDMKNKGGFNAPANTHVDILVERHLPTLVEKIDEIKAELETNYVDADVVVFPEHITKLKKDKIFIGSPMASVKESTYSEIRKCCLELQSVLVEECGFSEVYYPGGTVEGIDWHGQEKAILDDFKELKESEHYIFIYPTKASSSILMEMGYAIALSKNTLIFTKSKKSLPYMLQEADKAIPNIRIYEYKKFDEVTTVVKANGASLFTRQGG